MKQYSENARIDEDEERSCSVYFGKKEKQLLIEYCAQDGA